MLVNKNQLADIFGYTERTFTDYQKDPEFPYLSRQQGKSNQYDTREVYKYLIALSLKRAQVVSAKERLDTVRAMREDLAYRKDIKELIPAKAVTDVLSRVVIAIKTTLLNGGDKLKAELDALYDVDIDPELLSEHNRATLEQLAAIEIEFEDSDPRLSGEVQTTEEDDHGGLGQHVPLDQSEDLSATG